MLDNFGDSYNFPLNCDANATLGNFYAYLLKHYIAQRTIFYYNPEQLECSWQQWQPHCFRGHPQWVWQSYRRYPHLKQQHNSQLFSIACLRAASYMAPLMSLAQSLEHLKRAPILIEVVDGKDELQDSLAADILSYCLQQSLLHVVLYFKNWTRNLFIYSYVAFPHFKLLKQRFNQQLQLYGNQLLDLGGHALRALPDQSEPNAVLYRDASGQLHVTGYLWKFISAFAAKHKAQLELVRLPLPDGQSISHLQMLEYTRNGTTDIGVTAQMMPEKHASWYHQYSYPLVFGNWCLMLPLERPISVAETFAHVIGVQTLLLLLWFLLLYTAVLHLWPWLRSHCKRSHYILPLCSMALFLLCSGQAQLQSLLIVRPQHELLDSFDALLASDLRIFGMRSEFDFHDGYFRARYAAAFKLTSNVSELYALRRRFNTSYAYTITTMKWMVMATQQRHFERALFHFSDKLCMHSLMSFSLLLPEQSMYKGVLTHFILQAQQSGLLGFWLRNSFYDMVEAGRMRIEDYSMPRQLRALNLQDLAGIQHCFGAALLLALTAFISELLLFYWDVLLNLL